MICVLQTNSRWEADAAVAALRADGIECFLDGAETARIAGLSVPLVLRVMIFDPALGREARRIVDVAVREAAPMLSGNARRGPLQGVVRAGIGLAVAAVLVVVAGLLYRLLIYLKVVQST
jgi:hypothetical protein